MLTNSFISFNSFNSTHLTAQQNKQHLPWISNVSTSVHDSLNHMPLRYHIIFLVRNPIICFCLQGLHNEMDPRVIDFTHSGGHYVKTTVADEATVEYLTCVIGQHSANTVAH